MLYTTFNTITINIHDKVYIMHCITFEIIVKITLGEGTDKEESRKEKRFCLLSSVVENNATATIKENGQGKEIEAKQR